MKIQKTIISSVIYLLIFLFCTQAFDKIPLKSSAPENFPIFSQYLNFSSLSPEVSIRSLSIKEGFQKSDAKPDPTQHAIKWVIDKPESLQRILLKQALEDESLVNRSLTNIFGRNFDIKKINTIHIAWHGGSRWTPGDQYKDVYKVTLFFENGDLLDIAVKIFNELVYQDIGIEKIKDEISVLEALELSTIPHPKLGIYKEWAVNNSRLFPIKSTPDKFRIITQDWLGDGADLRVAQKALNLSQREIYQAQRQAIEIFTTLWYFFDKQRFFGPLSSEDPDISHIQVFKKNNRIFTSLTDPGDLIDAVTDINKVVHILTQYYPQIKDDIYMIVTKTLNSLEKKKEVTVSILNYSSSTAITNFGGKKFPDYIDQTPLTVPNHFHILRSI